MYKKKAARQNSCFLLLPENIGGIFLDFLIVGLLVIILVLLLLLLVFNRKNRTVENQADSFQYELREQLHLITKSLEESGRTQATKDKLLREEININMQKNIENQIAMLNQMLNLQMKQNQETNATQSEQFHNVMGFQQKQYQQMTSFQVQQQEILLNQMEQQKQKVIEVLQTNLKNIQEANENRLQSIQHTVDEKLSETLNKRLDSNFKQIGDQLGELYRSLGELNRLSTGVTDLNRTLSNVKTRGIWGEIQLQAILEQTMTSNQYDTNVATKKNSNERVEFAIKIPDKEATDEFIYLPIDSKMPMDIYHKIVDASEQLDAAQVQAACKELEQRIKTEAKSIHDKYINPPKTTDFAILFLPTEGLYAEVLRIDGLVEWCQSHYKIVISGPTTITALLNSLRVGFSNMALNRKSKEVLTLLQAIKTQYAKFSDLIDKTQKKLQDAMISTEHLKSRSNIIQNRMNKIEQLDLKQSDALLGIVEEIPEDEDFNAENSCNLQNTML